MRSREVGPEELKDDSEKSNLATANSIESRNMKDFMQENNGSGLSGENEKKPGEETEAIEAEVKTIYLAVDFSFCGRKFISRM